MGDVWLLSYTLVYSQCVYVSGGGDLLPISVAVISVRVIVGVWEPGGTKGAYTCVENVDLPF